jgi:single-stranded-DNA-specific exonuclease
MVEPNLADLLDLVALGTVADVVPLDRNNRILVAQGLARIRGGRCCAGIQALFDVAGRSLTSAVANDLGYAVAPRLNAAGRLEDMGAGIECLLSDDAAAARGLAQRLDALNRERRVIEAEMHEQALAHIDTLLLEEDAELPLGLCLFDADWHEGVVGIVASRIKERLHRPVIAFALTEGGTLKGSGRSVPGLHLRDALDSIAARNPGLLSKFGGHAMAAGLTLAREHFDVFAAAFNSEVGRHLNEDQLRGVVLSDGELRASEVSLDLAQTLRYAGPWGHGFPEPVFDGCFDVVQRRIVGERHLKLVLRFAQADQLVDAIAFNTTDADWPPATGKVWAAYRLDVNEYLGSRSVQLIVEHLQPC